MQFFVARGTRGDETRRNATNKFAEAAVRPFKLPRGKLVIRALLGFNEITGGAFSVKHGCDNAGTMKNLHLDGGKRKIRGRNWNERKIKTRNEPFFFQPCR